MPRLTMPRGVLLVTLGIALVLGAAHPRLEDLALVKVERQQSADPGVLDEASGLQELDSGWIAAVSATVLRRLQAAGLALTVLDQAPAGKHYFLVFGAGETDLVALRAAGQVIPIEPAVVLVAAADDQLRARLPGRLALAPLALSPPRLVRPVFETTAARGRAVPRAQAAVAHAAPDPRLTQAVGNVSRDRLSSTIQALESYQTRYATTTNLVAAGNYLFDQFRHLGLQVEYDDFTFTTANHPASNIVATIPGRTSPQDVVIVCSHYDSFSDERPAVAPGADDNASGTSAVLEAARVLAGVPLDFTVKLITFSAEEWGLYGSRHYAQEARTRGERIVAVVNLDMIGYADQLPEDLDVIANPASEWLVDRFRSVAAAYTTLAVLKAVSASTRSSDHAPFWDNGYSAVLCIEDGPLRNPYYHRVTDRFETLTMSVAEAVARATVAVVGDLAQPVGALSTPSALSVQTEVWRSLFSRAKRSVLQWGAVAGSSGYHVYRATASHGAYRRITTSPVTTSSFADDFVPANASAFYVVTAIDSQGRESNYSAEAAAR
jgi:Zn-dependent M28 family amino/carboxypeptidase